MDFSKFVEEQKVKVRRENIKEIRKDIDKPWVKEKILNHMKCFQGLFSYEEIKRGILENDLIASKFCKDPSKQNISEKLAAQVLKIDKLPASGKNCIRFTDSGDITSVSGNGKNTKSADFFYDGYYATQKYTDGNGGAQDNQRNDVIDFLKRGSLKYKVAAIVDGSYWDKYRFELQKEFKDNPNVLITSVTEITENI